ncbi:hypothetical protein [Prochlorothrix hollandica]|uniref:hypothetical protein n=1 Tax=Prochlorothrix hollandica TaxID=1223 RepID=UPI0011D2A99F|nr:hypothetical protein [Prochlorothrix hollandica]
MAIAVDYKRVLEKSYWKKLLEKRVLKKVTGKSYWKKLLEKGCWKKGAEKSYWKKGAGPWKNWGINCSRDRGHGRVPCHGG